jgi:hypothetical protein
MFVVLIALAAPVLGSGSPESDASASAVASYYDAHEVKQIVAAFLFAAAVPFLVLFGVSLAAAASEAETYAQRIWPRVLLVGTALAGAAVLVVALAVFAMADGASNDVAPSALQAINVLGSDAWILFNSGLGVLMLGAAGCHLAGAGTRLDRSLGWIALVLGIALFIPFADFVAMLATGLWIIVRGLTLSGEGRERGFEVAPRMA